MTERELLKDKKRIVIKIGSSSLTHAETGDLNLAKIEKLVRIISDMRGMGKEVILVPPVPSPQDARLSAERNRRRLPRNRHTQLWARRVS